MYREYYGLLSKEGMSVLRIRTRPDVKSEEDARAEIARLKEQGEPGCGFVLVQGRTRFWSDGRAPTDGQEIGSDER